MIIGREAQLAQLLAHLGEDSPAVVVGEAGVGKTTVLREAAARSERNVFEGGGLSTLSWVDYLPLVRALGRGTAGGDATAAAAEAEHLVGAGVLLLDDLQWADSGTLDAVALLAGRIGLCAGVRSGEPRSDAVVDALRDAGFAVLELTPLTPGESAELVRSVRPDLPPSVVDRLVERTGGNPLLLRELASTGEPSDSLRLAMAARLRHLDIVGRDAFGLLALAGRPVSVEDLGETGVKSLLAADLVVLVPDGVQIRHALLGEVAIAQMAADERAALHARIARGVDDDGEAARHYLLAGDTASAYAAAMRACDAATRPGERASHLAIAARCADGPDADQLRIRAARALEEANDWTGMHAVLDRLTPDNDDAQAWAALLRARGAWATGNIEELRTAVQHGLHLAEGTGSEIEVRLRIAQTRVPLFVDPDPAAAVQMARNALELAETRQIDVPRAEYLYGTALLIADQFAGAEHLSTAIALARDAGDTGTELVAANNLISMHESLGDPAQGRRLCVEFAGRSRELGLIEWERIFRVALVNLDFNAGNYADTISAAEELLEHPLDARSRDVVIEAYCFALTDVGRISEAERRLVAALDTAVQDYRGQTLLGALAEAALWGGRPKRALEAAEEYCCGTENDVNRVFGQTTRAWALFELGRDPGPALPRHPRQMVDAMSFETAGLQLLHRAGHADAAAAFDHAARLFAPFHRRGELRCAWLAGEALDRDGDVRGAVARLEAVEARADAIGMLPLLNRIRQSLRAAGIRRSAPRRRVGAGVLTVRERQVLGLVAEGLTNAEIAARLGVSRHTVVSQIASASTKLGASTRSQAASLAARLDDQASVFP